MLTPTQRRDLVTLAIEQRMNLGLLLIPVTSGQPWLADREGIHQAYNLLAETVSKLCAEVDWPGVRSLEVDNGIASPTPRE